MVSALCLLYKIYHRADHSMYEYLYHFVVGHNTRASVALGDLDLVILCCIIDQFSLSFLPAAVVCGSCCLRVCSVVEP